MVRLSPPDKVGEFFGLYGLVGKFSAVIGPLLYGADRVDPAERRLGLGGVPGRRS